jgi:hypothetical protein
LDAFQYLEPIENIADWESQLPPPALRWTATYTGPKAPLCESIVEPQERDTQGCLQTSLHNNSYYPFAMHEQYKSIQCGIKKKGMMTYYDNMLKQEITALHFTNVKNGDHGQNLLASMPEDQAIRKGELHTLEDI